MKIKRNQKGFTLIEVVLVLAIGGLIFLLAFLAFQQVSVNRRDTARRSDAARFSAEIQNYAGDNSGKVPASGDLASFVSGYLSSPKDPKGDAYVFAANTTGAAPTATPNVTYTPGNGTTTNTLSCDGTYLGTKDAKFQVKLEKGTVCRDTKGS